MKTLYLIRHAQSQANLEGRVQGWFDSPLTTTGERQAQRVAERLTTEITPARIFGSPLQRAARTAEIIAQQFGLPFTFDPELREYNMGPITGLTFAEIREQYPERHAAFNRNEPLPHLPGEEGEAVFSKRVRRVMERIVDQIPMGETGVVVSHSGVLNVALRLWLEIHGNSRRLFKISNCSITVMRLNGQYRQLTRLNDVCHLAHVNEEKQ